MDVLDLSLVVGGLFLAGVLKGATGIGYSTCALPFLVAGVGLRSAIAIVILPAIVSNAALMLSAGGLPAVARRFWRFYCGIIPGIAAGTYALAHMQVDIATQILGWLTVAYVWLSLSRPDLALSSVAERVLAAPAGVANGFLTGLTGSQILPLMPYMMSLRLQPTEQIQAVNLAVTIASAVLSVALFNAGILTPALLVVSAMGCLPAMLGVLAGNHVRERLSSTTFRSLSLMMLAVIAISLISGHARSQKPICEQAASSAGVVTATRTRTR